MRRRALFLPCVFGTRSACSFTWSSFCVCLAADVSPSRLVASSLRVVCGGVCFGALHGGRVLLGEMRGGSTWCLACGLLVGWWGSFCLSVCSSCSERSVECDFSVVDLSKSYLLRGCLGNRSLASDSVLRFQGPRCAARFLIGSHFSIRLMNVSISSSQLLNMIAFKWPVI